MAKKEKKKKAQAYQLAISKRPHEQAQHNSFASHGATFAWKLSKISMGLNIFLIVFTCLAFIYGISKPNIYVAASSNINLTKLEPLKR